MYICVQVSQSKKKEQLCGMAGAGNASGETRPQLAELEGKDSVTPVLHLSAGPRGDDYKGLKRREAGERAEIVSFMPLQRRVTSPICNPVWQKTRCDQHCLLSARGKRAKPSTTGRIVLLSLLFLWLLPLLSWFALFSI